MKTKTAAKHTPGPWKIEHVTRPLIGKEWWAVYIQPDKDGPRFDIGSFENEADARLIAAAPDLLAAAERLSGLLPDGHGHWEASMQPALDQIRAAIAKAGSAK